MFTFFHQVTFVVVFLPLLIMVPLTWVAACMIDLDSLFPVVLAACSIPSIVLLMLKMDDLFEVGTAITIGSAFPEFSWAVIMIPIWAGFVVTPLATCTLTVLFEGCDD